MTPGDGRGIKNVTVQVQQMKGREKEHQAIARPLKTALWSAQDSVTDTEGLGCISSIYANPYTLIEPQLKI